MSKENPKLFGNGIKPKEPEPRFPGVDESWVYDPETNNYHPAPEQPAETIKS